MAIQQIRIKDLRALKDTGDIPLKLITVLVGKNSVGKSTFARIFPLLRQSYEEKRRAPILWWGKYVDFGSFNEAVNRTSESKEIALCFSLEIGSNKRTIFFYEDQWQMPLAIAEGTKVDLEIVISSEREQTYVSRTTIKAGDLSCCVTSNVDGTIGEITAGTIKWTATTDISVTAATGELLPVPRYTRKTKNKDGVEVVKQFNPIAAKLLDAFGQFVHRNTSSATLMGIAQKVPFLESQTAVLTSLYQTGTPALRRTLSELGENDSNILRLRQWLLINSLPRLYMQINTELRAFSLGVRYLEPLRATAQRFYRAQELAVDDIDSKGENLAVFVHSLSPAEKIDLNLWLSDKLGFELNSTREGGHISLRVKFINDDGATNIADTGFGISQVLPIAIQLWTSLSRSTRGEIESKTSCFVVEQPELHLHPAFQENIADLFVATVTDPRTTRIFPIIAETHSPSFINRLGELVAQGKISKDNIQVVLFDQAHPSAKLEIRTVSFDDDGVLQNWPFGFFSSGKTE